jgi:hypothetical protein
MRRRRLTWVLGLLALPAFLGAAVIPEAADAKIDAWLAGRLRIAGRESFLVRFDSTEGLRAKLAVAPAGPGSKRAVYDLLRARARGGQERVRAFLEKLYRPLYLVNAIQVEGDLDLARVLAAFPDVARITGDPLVRGVSPPVVSAVESTEWGLDAIHAPLVWSSDHVRGESIVVASADTGVEWFHPAIIAQYRGWGGQSASHDFNWHDSIQDLDTPLDDYGHGTHTTGTIIRTTGPATRSSPGGWIGCRNMDHGVRRLHLPRVHAQLARGRTGTRDGRRPSKAPDIVNNSWTCPPSEGAIR